MCRTLSWALGLSQDHKQEGHQAAHGRLGQGNTTEGERAAGGSPGRVTQPARRPVLGRKDTEGLGEAAPGLGSHLHAVQRWTLSSTCQCALR